MTVRLHTGAPRDVERRTTPPTDAEHAELRSLGVPADAHMGYVITAAAAGVSLRELVDARKRAASLNSRASAVVREATTVEHAATDGPTARVRRLFPLGGRR